MNLSKLRWSKSGIVLTSTLKPFSTCGIPNPISSEFHIPMRKERDSTDILRVIERTIKRDPTAPCYKYHDDPYLIPISNTPKRVYSLAEESGRKAAMWIREQHSNLFEHRVADPVIELFLPKTVYTEKIQVSEDLLKKTIENGHVMDALTIYKLLEEDINVETKVQLLQLLCYYNNDKPLHEESINERWLRNAKKSVNWKDDLDTVKLFKILKEQDIPIATEAFNAMICGCVKFMNISRAWELFEEANQKNILLSVNAYNSLIATIPKVKDLTDDRQRLLKDLLVKMKNHGIKPNTRTLNSALKIPVAMRNRVVAENLCLSLFAEFQCLGIKPSLASYNYCLQIFYRKDSPRNFVLNEIITKLENEQFIMKDQSDLYFFMIAMEVSANFLEDAVLGDRIHKLLMSSDNYKFIGDGLKQNIYYRNYLILQVKNQVLNEFVNNYYNIIVPHIYTPESSVMDSILNALEANEPEMSRALLPKFWTHIVQFNHLEKKNLIDKSLNLMRTHCKPPKNSPIHKIFADAGLTVWNYVMNQQQTRTQKITWTGTILCNIAILYLRADEVDKCHSVIKYLYNERQEIVGTPERSQIEELFQSFMVGCYLEPAIDLVHYCSYNGYEDSTSMANEVLSNLSLNEWQRNRIQSLIDSGIPEIPVKISQELHYIDHDNYK